MPTHYLSLHPDNPQPRLVAQIAARIQQGAIMAYPTDSSYALGCHLGDKEAMDRIRSLRNFGKRHLFTLVCANMTEVANFARVDNWHFRLLKHTTPGPYTFLLTASHQVPRRLLDGKRKTIGVRLPDNRIAQALLAELGEPILSCTLLLPGRELPFSEPWEIQDELSNQLDLIIDGGPCGYEPTTVVDLSGDDPHIVRQGKGPADALGL